jgi:hypothetical protein
MSFNRLTYDVCEYSKELKKSTTTLDYMLNPMAFENENKCRHQLGLVGGPTVSHIRGNLVDLESDLRGQTRLASQCPSRQYLPTPVDGVIKNDKTAPIDTRMLHLPACQMISYKSVPLPHF